VWRNRPAGKPTPEDFGVRSAIITGGWIIAVFFGAIGAWIAMAPLNAAVVAPGIVKVESNRKTVQHQEGGIVRKILVRDGDLVKTGQPLILLEDIHVDASVEILHDQLDAELISEARLQSEKSMASSISFPREILNRATLPQIKDFIARETILFNSRRSALNSQLALLQEQIQQVDQEIRGLQHQIESEQQSIAYSNQELDVNQPLYEKNFIAKARMLQLQRTVSDYQVKLGEHMADLAKARQLKSELNMRTINLRSQYAENAAEELKNSSGKIATIREQIRPTEDAASRQTIMSPASGKIVGLRVFTEGAAIGPREPLMDIVPQDSTLLVEAKVDLDSISSLHLGQEASIRFSAFKQRTTPMVSGKVIYISADSMSDKEGGSSYYSIRILPDPASLKEAGNLDLQAGMAAEAYIMTEARTALDYMLEPVTQTLLRAFRER